MVENEKADGRRHSLNTRTTLHLRNRLEEAAKVSGRSLAQEVEARLEKSFAEEDMLLQVFRVPHDMLLLRTLALVLHKVQRVTQTRWSVDLETLRQCQMAVEQILFGLWGNSRRDNPKKSQAYVEKIDSRLPEGVELASWAVSEALSEMGLAFPREPGEPVEPPPKGVGLETTFLRNH